MRTNGLVEMILALVTVNPKFASRQDFLRRTFAPGLGDPAGVGARLRVIHP